MSMPSVEMQVAGLVASFLADELSLTQLEDALVDVSWEHRSRLAARVEHILIDADVLDDLALRDELANAVSLIVGSPEDPVLRSAGQEEHLVFDFGRSGPSQSPIITRRLVAARS